MDFAQFGWRDGVLVLAVIAAVYLAFALLRLSQVGHRNKAGFDSHAPLSLNETQLQDEIAAEEPPPVAEAAGVAPVPPAPAAGNSASLFHFPSFRRAAPNALAGTAGANDMAPDAVPLVPRGFPPVTPSTFGEALTSTRVEQEVRQLRSEVAALRQEVLELEASRRVSPQYADAMALAQRGYDTQGIADQCGISLGEAELVRALAQGVQDTEAEDAYAGIN